VTTRPALDFSGIPRPQISSPEGSRSPAIAAFVRAAVEIAQRRTHAFTAAAP
jgi:hypothetical protein